MTEVALLAEIAAEAERIRSDGSLPPHFEEKLRATFDGIAADPRALEAEVARRRETGDGPSAPTPAGRAVARAARASRRALGAARRRIGPPIRSSERRIVERAGRALDLASTEVQVWSDAGRRLAAGTVAERALGRAGAAAMGSPASLDGSDPSTPRALRVGQDGRLGDPELDSVLSRRLGGARGIVLHAECGDGSLVARLASEGLEAVGVDPRRGVGAGRRGPLEALARSDRGSLGGIVLSGVPDRVTPASARALVRLVASRLSPGGRVVVLSAHPGPREASDPVVSDLTHGRPLHPATWCHLFARLGLEEISVREAGDGSAYAVAATSSGGRG